MVLFYRTVDYVLIALMCVAIWIAFMVSAGQVVWYLYRGTWVSVSYADLLERAGSDWAANPSSWIGVHEILSWMHPVVGAIVFLIVAFVPWKLASEMVSNYEWEQTKERLEQDEE